MGYQLGDDRVIVAPRTLFHWKSRHYLKVVHTAVGIVTSDFDRTAWRGYDNSIGRTVAGIPTVLTSVVAVAIVESEYSLAARQEVPRVLKQVKPDLGCVKKKREENERKKCQKKLGCPHHSTYTSTPSWLLLFLS